MSLIKRDNNELRYNSIFLLTKQGNPDYYKELIRNSRAFFYGMRREDLNDEMNNFIKKNIEKRCGKSIDYVLLIYRYMNNFKNFMMNPHTEKYIYKQELNKWLDQLEQWIFINVVKLEDNIRFTIPPKQWV
ncbi:hypothetical protein CCP1ISM_260002 [Azospirillaceae bacterium]